MTIVVGGRRRVLARVVAAGLLVVVALLGGLSLASADQGVSRDPSFGAGGRVVVADTVVSGGSGIYDVRTQGDGILVGVRSDVSEVRRYLATGELDVGFGVGGTLEVGGDGSIAAWWLSSGVADPIVVALTTPAEGTYVRRWKWHEAVQ